MTDTGWTDARVTQLRQFWAEGATAREIADQMGGISRSGVLGKAHRLNLSGRSRNPHPRKPAPVVERKPPLNEGRAKPPRPRRSQPPACTTMQRTIIRPARAGIYGGEVETVDVPEAMDLPPDESAFACTIVDLTDERCHWPIGDPSDIETFRYCGADADGRRYCPRHHRLAHKANGYRGAWG